MESFRIVGPSGEVQARDSLVAAFFVRRLSGLGEVPADWEPVRA